MTLKQAIESGKRYRLKDEKEWNQKFHISSFFYGDKLKTFQIHEILSDDWEVEPESKVFTENNLISLIYDVIEYTTGNIDSKIFLSSYTEGLIKNRVLAHVKEGRYDSKD